MKLTVELVPKTSWYSNVRSQVPKKDWDRIRKLCYKKADNKCEICGDVGTNQGRKHKVECHEIWKYDDINKKQILKGFIALCPKCHQVKHIGLSLIRGQNNSVFKHMSKINNISLKEVETYVDQIFELWGKRSQYQWEVDTSYINKYLKNE